MSDTTRAALSGFSSESLTLELRRRDNAQHGPEHRRRYCDDCKRFDRESGRCIIGHQIKFRTPRDYTEAHAADWGWIKRGCRDYRAVQEVRR